MARLILLASTIHNQWKVGVSSQIDLMVYQEVVRVGVANTSYRV